MTSLAMVAATLTMSAATVVVTASPSQADVGGSPSAEALALAEAARTGHRVEVTEEDTETETVYANPDGTLTSEVTQVPTRVQQADGDLVPVDLDLASTDGRLAPKASAVDVTLSATGDGQLANVTLPGDASFGMQLSGGVGAPDVTDRTATYAVSGADPASVQFATSATGFSARVSIPSAPATGETAPTYTFPLKLDGLHASLSHQQLVLTNETGDTVATSAPLVMWDARVDTAGDPLKVVPVDAALVDTPDGGTALQLSPSMDYLNDAATQYPVVVDPDLSFDSDTMVSSGANADTAYAGAYKIRVGNSGGSTWRILEKFNIDPYMGDNVTSATLKMFQYYGASCNAATTNVYPTKPFGGGPLTWNTQPDVLTSSNWSSTFTANNGSSSSGCPDAFDSIDVTKLMNGYTSGALDSGKAGTGDTDEDKTHVATIELRAAGEASPDSDKRFCSMNFSPAEDVCNTTANQPKLTLTYSPDLGEKASYSTTDHRLNDRTTLKINNQDGNVLVKADDVKIRSLGQDLTISRYYNSLSTESGAFGPGWSTSVGPDVRLENRGGNRFDYHAPSGAVYAGFVRNTTDQTDPEYRNFSTPHGGVGASLHDEANGKFTLTFHQSQKVYTFEQVDPNSNDYYLTQSADRTAAADDLDGTGTKPNQLLTYSYVTGTHRLASITDPSGHTVSVHYNTSGFVDTITDANGPTSRTWTYAYTSGRLTSYTDPAGSTTTYGWTTGSNPQVNSIADPAITVPGTPPQQLRPTVTIGYTGNQPTSIMYASDAGSAVVGYIVAFTSTTAGPCADDDDYTSQWHSTDTATGDTWYCFRDRGDSGGQTTHRVIDGMGNRRTSKFTLDAQPSLFTGGGTNAGAKSGSTVATYAGGGLADRLASVADPKDDGATNASKTSLTYSYAARADTDADGDGNKTNDANDFPGEKYAPSAKLDGNGQCTGYAYDGVGRLTDAYLDDDPDCSGQSDGLHYHQEFNNNNATDSTNTGPDGTVKWSYDPNGSSALEERTDYTYWMPGQPGYVAGSKGQVKTVSQPRGNCATDSTRRLCTSYTYDGLGRVTTMTDGRGKVTSYTYDKLDRVTQVLVDGASTCNTGAGTCVTYTYDAEGNMTQRVDAQGTTTFGYDRLNRQTQISTPDASVTSYGYNDEGKINRLDVSVQGAATQTWTYDYDDALQPKTVTTSIGGVSKSILLTHDNDSRLATTTLPTTPAVTITRHYTNAGRPQDIKVTESGDTGGAQLPDWDFSYQNNGNDTNQVQQINVTGSTDAINDQMTYAYGYAGNNNDNHNDKTRLTSAKSRDGADYTYDYDDAANLKTEQVGGTYHYYGYDRAGQLCWQQTTTTQGIPTPSLYKSCVTTVPSGTTKVNQDAAGNSQGTTSTPLAYNAYNQVSSIAGRTQTYNDLGNDLRIATDTGIGLVNSTLGVIARKTSAGITYYTRSPDGKLLGEFGASDTYYYVTDNQDSITTLIDAKGARAGYYHYSPYGTPTIVEDNSSNAAANNPWRYIGGYYDIEGDGYTKLGARYYDGRSHFTQPDPKPGSFSDPLNTLSYGYAGADPMDHSDASGRDFSEFLGTLGDIYTLSKDEITGDREAAFNDAAGIGAGIIVGAVVGGLTGNPLLALAAGSAATALVTGFEAYSGGYEGLLYGY